MDNELLKLIEDQKKCIQSLESRIEFLEKKESARSERKMTIFLIDDALDKALPAFSLSNWAAVMGYEVSIFCALWGINLVRKNTNLKGNTILEKIAKTMLKAGPEKAVFSHMHWMGIGTKFTKTILKEHQIEDLPCLLQSALDIGVKVYASETIMGIMGIKEEELIDGVESCTGLVFIQKMSEASVNLVF